MRLLTETTDINELNRLKILFESNGIPLFIGGEDTVRNAGIFMPAVKYGVFILYEEQFYDAQCLLKDENHIVEHPVDMDEFRRHMEMSRQPFIGKRGIWITVVILAVLFAAFVWMLGNQGKSNFIF
jgi:hypothetical protein